MACITGVFVMCNKWPLQEMYRILKNFITNAAVILLLDSTLSVKLLFASTILLACKMLYLPNVKM